MNGTFSRREFLSATTAAVAASTTSAAGWTLTPSAAGDINLPITRIRKVYLAKPVPTWPKPDLDVAAEMRRLDAHLSTLANSMPGIRLEGDELYRVPDEVPSSLDGLGKPEATR